MSSMVSVSARVVAAGVVDAKAGRVRLTISLMPVGGGGDIDIGRWPEVIHNKLRQGDWLKLIASPIEVPSEAALEPPTGNERGLALPYDLREFDVKGVQELWQEVANDAVLGIGVDPKLKEERRAEKFWVALADVFKIDDKKPAYLSDSALPNVLPTGRSDAAIVHILARAKRLDARLKSPNRALPVDGIDGNIDAGSVDPWGKVKDEQGPIDVANPEHAERVRKLLEAALADERNSLVASANGYITKNQPYLQALAAPSAPGAARPPREPTLVNFSIGELFGADSAQVLTQTQNLHAAALLPDNEQVKARPKGALPKGKASEIANVECDVAVCLPGDFDHVARTLVAAIRTSPMLARLFRFVFDVEISLPQLMPQGAQDYAFAFLGAGVPETGAAAAGEVVRDRLIFTIAKAVKGPDGQPAGFWPATREELKALRAKVPMSAIPDGGTVTQRDGVVVLGQVSGTGKGRNPRFDIISIDPALAMDTSIRNARRKGAAASSATRLGLQGAPRLGVFEDEFESGLVNRGLTIVDRWRAESVAREIITARRARAAESPLRILDGDDLTVGYRVDVAVRFGEAGEARWRSLMEREIDYRRLGQEHGANDQFRGWFRALSLDRLDRRRRRTEFTYEADRRRDLDAGIMLPTARRRLISDDREMIHAEELIAAWEGDPLGLNCGKDDVTIVPGGDVAISRSYDLPSEDDEDDRKAWPLRYGWAYRFGIRPVWLGGVSLALENAKPLYDATSAGYRNLSLPTAGKMGAIDVAGWRRFLRHEPMLAPVALLPQSVAEEEHPFLRQSGVRAILRTLDSDAENKAKRFAGYLDRETEGTWRVILPPRVSLDEAIRQGVFDQINQETPPGALLDIDYDTPTNRERLQGRVDPNQKLHGKEKGFPTVELIDPLDPNPTEGEEPRRRAFEDFFRVHPAPIPARVRGGEENQYYVDPMADQLVVAIRPNTDRPGSGYFAGAPRTFDVGRGPYGSVKPVALKIEPLRTLDPRPNRDLTQDDFWNGKTQSLRIDGKAPRNGRLAASVAMLRLRPGEAVDVDCWFVPSLEKLRAYYDWPETLAVKAAYDTGDVVGNTADHRRAIIKKLQEGFAKEAADLALSEAEITDIIARYDGQPAWVGLAGLPADPAVVAAAAQLLHRHMLRYPIPEIAAVRTIDVVHAVARPPRPPKFDADKDLVVLRTPSEDGPRLKVLQEWRELRALQPSHLTPEQQKRLAAMPLGSPGNDGIVFAGAVEVDRDTCRQLELRAFCVSPARVALDDVNLGRTELQRLLGEWPERVAPKDALGVVEEGTESPAFELKRSAPFLFGFDVDRDGRVTLPKQWITLLQLDQLEERTKESRFRGLESIDLTQEQIDTLSRRAGTAKDKAAAQDKKVRAAPLDRYSDRLARKLLVALRATSRFDAHFVRIAPTKDSPLPETMFPPNPDHAAALITRSSCERPFHPFTGLLEKPPSKSERTEFRELWIPATIAPAKPRVHAVLPAYRVIRPKAPGTDGKDPLCERHWTHQRTPRLRVYLDRPWFSSGEGERLGLVLWPPQLKEIASGNKADSLQRGRVPRAVLHNFAADSQSDVMELADFLDDDLGAGGKFTTRWGADPIRQNFGPLGPFLPREALLDLPSGAVPAPADDAVGYVPSIAIPLQDPREKDEQRKKDEPPKPAGGEEKPKAADPDAYKGHDTLTAALATYVPRFDVESERWFVDIALNPHAMMEPFVRLGLVRYQAQAAEGLRVSAPVAVWGQLPPERQVDVWSRRNGNDTVLTVQVSGHVSGRASTDAGTADELTYPRLRVSVFDVAKLPSRLDSETIAGARRDGLAEPVPAIAWAEESCTPKKGGPTASPRPWCATFVLPPLKSRNGTPAPKGRNGAPPLPRPLAVVVEEVEEFLSTADEDASPPLSPPDQAAESPAAPAPSALPAPAAYAGPVDTPTIPGDAIAKGKQRSGPRFLARLDIEA